jgi:hypothetical protein
MKSMMLTYRAAEIPARSGEQSWPRHHHRYADDVTAKPKPELSIENISEDSVHLFQSAEEIVQNLSSTFADRLHSEAGDPETATVKARLNLIRRAPNGEQLQIRACRCGDLRTEGDPGGRSAIGTLDVTFPFVLDALVETHASTMAFDKLETSHSLYQSSLDFALAHRINAEVRLRDLNIPEPEIRLLQEYLIKNPGALVGTAANSVAE